jgi:hypothetical protein
MIIFESLMTTFEASAISSDNWSSSKNWLELKTKLPLPNLTKLSLSKSMICTVERGTNKEKRIIIV